jgi:hypothetical protein
MIPLDGEARTDFRRDRWGRPLIVPATGGKARPYTRASSAAKTIEDTWNLEMWARRNVAYGMSYDPSLVARVIAVGGNPGSWDQAAKGVVNKVHEDAQKVAQANKAADIGTAVHTLTERLDRGEDVDGGPYQADLDAYRAALDAAGFVCNPDWVECRMACDELEIAGTADRILTNGGYYIGDLKTGPTVDYGGLGWAAQLACYAHSDLYNIVDDSRQPTPKLDQATGIIIHLPAGQGRCTLYEIDLVAGYRAAQLANEVRAVRKESKRWIVPKIAGEESARVASPAPTATKEEPCSVPESPKPTTPSNGPSATSTPPATAPSTTTSALSRQSPAPPTARSTSSTRRQKLLQRYKQLTDDDQAHFRSRNVNRDDLDAVEEALNAIDPFHGVSPPQVPSFLTPRPNITVTGNMPVPLDVDEGPDMPAEVVDGMGVIINDLPTADRDRLNRIAKEAYNTVGSISMVVRPTRRRWEIARALTAWARAGWDDDIVRAACCGVTDDPAALQPGVPLGTIIGALTIDQAVELTVLADKVEHGLLVVDCSTGAPKLVAA